ncbi:WXG100 family type VII secretion target [Streptomyces sp. NRRL S-237]|uniref:WXG100 family type VII secretion target n=1 Tax=Streptomyces sp. NRRL S-237 TaxID=1463895 RepID=UPI00131D8B10|nr:WXG100 family type VII secretion target [Streptomyces sp. NRRL S-237]
MTDFESFTHQQMRDMIASLDATSVQARADQLASAAKKIKTIGDALKKHVVTGWEGEGADAFQEWVGRAGNATLRLGDYSAKGGEWMGKVVQAMTEASKMTAVDATATKNLAAAIEHHNDPDAAKVRSEAQTILDADHREAVRLMTNLAQSYQVSSSEMNKATIPTFPPPPPVLVPQGYDGGSEEMARSGGGLGGGVGSAGSSYTAPASSHGTSSGDAGSVTGRSPQPDSSVPSVTVPSIPDREVDVDLDSVATLPDRTAPPVTITPGPLPTGPVGPTPGPVLPPMGFPPVGVMKPPSLTGPGIGPYPALGGPGTPPPGGKVLGTPGLPPRDSGITGGRPVTSTGPSSGIPRGTVIGEGAQAGRGMGGGMGHGGGHGGGQSGFAAGRRLASEPGGGVVGGRQTGAVGRPVTGGQPFTQGGSGLVRNGAGGAGMGSMGHAGAGTQAPGKRRNDQSGERPDYLAEDEETWQGNRRVVPPVID